jgi:hypothetical protein
VIDVERNEYTPRRGPRESGKVQADTGAGVEWIRESRPERRRARLVDDAGNSTVIRERGIGWAWSVPYRQSEARHGAPNKGGTTGDVAASLVPGLG